MHPDVTRNKGICIRDKLRLTLTFLSNFALFITEVYLEPCQTFKMEVFVKTVNGRKPLTIFAKSSTLGVWQSQGVN